MGTIIIRLINLFSLRTQKHFLCTMEGLGLYSSLEIHKGGEEAKMEPLIQTDNSLASEEQ